MADPKITLYTHLSCPAAHRVLITLSELGLSFKTEIVDLETPRTQEYLAINPRGLVPSLRYNDTILTESAVIVQFLADAHPDKGLLPPSNAGFEAALTRARVAFFADAFQTKVLPAYATSILASTDSEAHAGAEAVNAAVVKELEPLLADASPFFGGSAKLTLAEAIAAPLVLRFFRFSERQVMDPAMITDLETRAPNFYKWAQAVIAHPSVKDNFDEEFNVEYVKGKVAIFRGKKLVI